MSGWIKTHRAIQSHWIFSDAEKYRAWMIILFTVNFEPKKVNIKNTVFECKRGESLLSLDSWADLFGKKWNKSKVRRFFICLENDSMIVTKSEHKTTRLTVCNYDLYQDERNADETQMKRKRNADETQTTPTKEGKEVEEGKNDKEKEYLSIWENFPYKSEFKKVLNLFEEKFRPKTPTQKINWLDIFEKTVRLDGYDPEKIVELIGWAREDHFWKTNLMSLASLRNKGKGGIKKIDSINAKFSSEKTPVQNQAESKVDEEEPKDYSRTSFN